jgi:signal peptidase I
MSTMRKIREYALSILFAAIIAITIRTFVVQPFKIPSGSMENTLQIGDHLLVNKFIYGTKIPFAGKRLLSIRAPERGDVIVFEYPGDSSKDFIKRVIGAPGDSIEIKDKNVYVNGKMYKNIHEMHNQGNIIPKEQSPRDNFGPVRVPSDAFFVMGDNRDNSYDSRFWGFVKSGNIKGLAFIKYWSWDKGSSHVRWDRIGKLID